MEGIAQQSRLKRDVQNARLASLREGLNIELSGCPSTGILSKPLRKWSDQELIRICKKQYQVKDPASKKEDILNFVDSIYEIEEMILNKDNPENIRAKINKAMSTKIYQQLKTEEHNPAIEFLQVLSIKELSADGEEALKKYGEKILGPLDNKEYTWGELASLMDGPASAIFAYKKNGFISKAIFSLANPVEALNNLKSELLPMQFNGYDGNPNMRGLDFSYKGKEMQFYYGPNPTGDRLYTDGVLVYMDKLNAKGVKVHELRQNFQSIRHHAEALRNFEMMRYEQAHPTSMRLLAQSFDSEAMDMTPRFMQFDNPSQFMLLYAKYIMAENVLEDPSMTIDAIQPQAHSIVLPEHKKDNGFYVGEEKAITDDRFKQAFQCADAVFTALHKNNQHWDALIQTDGGKQRLGRLMQIGTHAIISMGAIVKSLKEIDSPEKVRGDIENALNKKLDDDLAASRVSGACKQDIDRGVIENITLRLFFRLLENDAPLTKEEIYSIAGAVIGRARLVEDRLILWSRYEVLSDLLKFVDNQENVAILSDHLRAYAENTTIPTSSSSSAL